MKLKKTAVAAAVVTALAMGAAGQASASVYAGSRLLVDNLLVRVTNIDPTSLPAVQEFSFTTTSTATLNATGPVTQTLTCGTIVGATPCSALPPVLDTVASLGAPVRPAGDYTFFGPGVSQTYAGSAAQIDVAELVQGVPTETNQISETEIAASGVGITSTVLGSESSFLFVFEVGDNGDLFLSFNADPNLYVAVDTENLLSAFATATISASFNLVGTNGVQVSWAPDGAALGFAPANCDDGGLGAISCNELADSESLNITRTIPAGNPIARGFSDDRLTLGPVTGPASADQGFQPYAIQVANLPGGTYTLSGTFTTFARAEQAVPEPGTLLLIGSGLIGLGFGALRRRRSAPNAA